VDDESSVPYPRLREELATQTKQALLHPVFFGSALTGAGVESLIGGISELLPAAEGDRDADASGTVFKVERGKAGRRSPTSACSPGRSECENGCGSARTSSAR
jgi:ribosomal protection tetracycline resistance protein